MASQPPSERTPPASSRASRPAPVAAASGAATSRLAVGTLLFTMLLVPIGVLLVGRSFAAMLDRLPAMLQPSQSPAATAEPKRDAHPPVLRVKVVDADGVPVLGAAVRLVTTGREPELVNEGLTDASGTAAFAALRRAGSEGAAGPAPRVHIVASRDPEGVVTSGDVGEAPAGETRDVELALSPAEVVLGTVVDADGQPVAGATLGVESMPWAVPSSASTDPSGAFRLVTVPHDAPAITAAARGYLTGRATLDARRAAREPAPTTLSIRLVAAPPIEGDVTDVEGHPVRARVIACEGEPAEAKTVSGGDGTFTLPPAAAGCAVIATHDAFAPSDAATANAGRRLALRLKAGGAIEGHVVDDRGAPVSAFTVGIESGAAARGKTVRSGASQAFEDRLGAFRLENLSPGTYVLSATAPGKPPARSEPIEVAAGAPTRGVRITLQRGGVVKGHVYDEQHAPVGGVELRFDEVSSAVTSSARTRSDDTGAYELEGAPSGPFTLRAEKSGFRQRLVTGLVAASGTTLTTDVVLTASSGGGPNMELGGIGATLGPSSEGPIIRGVFPGDPADKAGLRAGDRIVRVDGEPTDNLSLADVLQRVRGEPGTTVGISVVRESGGAKEPFDAVVVRAAVVH